MGALPPEVLVKDLPGSRGNSLSLKETRSGSRGLGARWETDINSSVTSQTMRRSFCFSEHQFPQLQTG